MVGSSELHQRVDELEKTPKATEGLALQVQELALETGHLSDEIGGASSNLTAFDRKTCGQVRVAISHSAKEIDLAGC